MNAAPDDYDVVYKLAPAIGGARGNRFCGPGALAMLLAIGTDEAAALLRQVNGKRSVFGVVERHMVDALRSAGARAYPVPLTVDRVETLQAFARTTPQGNYLVAVTGHYVAVHVSSDGIEAGDNRTVYPMALDKFPRRRQRVRAAWKVTR